MTTPSPTISAPYASCQTHRDEIDGAIRRVLDSGRYILGNEVASFEREFAEYIGVREAIGVGSGTDALQLALRACGVGRSDIVITVSFTAVATVAAIELAGAEPILVDINPHTFTIDVAKLERAVESYRGRVKAIIAVHLYGHPAAMESIMKIAARQGLFVIEDCAQSHGATLNGRKTGAWGHLAAFSFYPTKNLGGLGDGGALTTDDSRLAARVRLLREYGWRTRYVSEMPGMNSRLDELQAAILRTKLRYLDKDNERRRQIAALYDRLLQDLKDIITPTCVGDIEHAYHQYVIRCKIRDRVVTSLRTNAVCTAILYPLPIHKQPAYRGRLSEGPGALFETEAACQEILSLPMHPYLSDEQVCEVGRLTSLAVSS